MNRAFLALALFALLAACGRLGATPTPTTFPTLPPVTPASPAPPTATASGAPATATAGAPTATATSAGPGPALDLQPLQLLGRGQAFGAVWSPDASRLALGTSLGVHVFDAATLAPVQFLRSEGPVYVVAFSPDCTSPPTPPAQPCAGLLAGGGVGQTGASADQGQVWVWDLATGALTTTLTTGYWINDLALTAADAAGGRLLAVGGLFPTTSAQVWDLNTNEPLMVASPGTGDVPVGASVALSPDGTQLALAGGAGGVFLYHARTGELQRALAGVAGPVYDLAYSPSGALLAAGGEAQAALWDVAAARALHVLPGTGPAWRVAFSPNGQSLAYTMAGSLQVVSTASGQPQRSLPAAEALPPIYWTLGFAPDGTLRAADNRQVLALDPAGSLAPPRALEGFTEAVQGLAFGPGHRLIASELSALRLWEADTGRMVRAWAAAAEGQPALSPDGRQLASGVCTQPGAGSDPDCLQRKILIWDTETGAELRALEAHTSTISAVSYSPEGRWLASAGADTLVYLWDAASGARVHTLAGHSQPVASLAFSPDGQTLASGGYDNEIRLWDVASGALRATLDGSSSAVIALAYSPDGVLLASGSASPDSQVRLWNTTDGSLRTTLPGHLGQVRALAFHPAGGWLVSGGAPAPSGPDDFTLRLWRLTPAGAELYHTFRPHHGAIFAVAFSPDGKRMATGSFDATVQVFAVE
jgi:WD40 repeat protein